MKKRGVILLFIFFVLGAGAIFFYYHQSQNASIPAPEDAQYFIVNAQCEERNEQGQRLGKMKVTEEKEDYVWKFLQKLKPFKDEQLLTAGISSGPVEAIWVECEKEKYSIKLCQTRLPGETDIHSYLFMSHQEGENWENAEHWLCKAPSATSFQEMQRFIQEYDQPIQWYFEYGEYLEN